MRRWQNVLTGIYLVSLIEPEEEAWDEVRYGFPARLCPICTLKHIRAKDQLAYLKAKYTLSDIEGEIRARFPTLNELNAHLKG